MKALTCTKCGGQINPNTHKCEYCGTYYYEEVTYEVVRERDDYQTIAAHVSVPFRGMCDMPSKLSKDISRADSQMAVDLIREKIADAILPFIDINVGMPDPRDMSVPICGRVRVKPVEHDRVHYY